MAGTTDKVKGAVEEGAGKLAGDKQTEAEGKADRAEGAVEGAARGAKGAAKGGGDSLKEK